MKKWIKNIGLILLKSFAAYMAILAVLYLVFIFGPYDNSKSKSVTPPSLEDFSNIDISKFEQSKGEEYFFMTWGEHIG